MSTTSRIEVMGNAKLSRDVQLVVKEFRFKVGMGRKFLSEEMERAMVALIVLDMIRVRTENDPQKTAATYAETYEDACDALRIGW